MPFAKSVELNATASTEFPTAIYILKVDPNAYFSFVFVSPDSFNMSDHNLVTLNYTFYGSHNYNYTGIWLDMNLKFNKDIVDIYIN